MFPVEPLEDIDTVDEGAGEVEGGFDGQRHDIRDGPPLAVEPLAPLAVFKVREEIVRIFVYAVAPGKKLNVPRMIISE